MACMHYLRWATLLAVAMHAVAAATCPPDGFDSAADFSVSKFISQPWFAQRQIVKANRRGRSCVMADFSPLSSDFNSGFLLITSGRKNVKGRLEGSSGNGLDLVVVPTVQLESDGTSHVSNGASKMQMIPLSLINARETLNEHFGHFWVLAVGDSADGRNYDWAIVSGGAPHTTTDNGCVPGPANATEQSYATGAGLWLFSRQPVDPRNTAVMLQTAQRLGLDVTVLKSVQQKGCDYAAVASVASASIANARTCLQAPVITP